uniref:Uncharacterized protein n=1 Tax=Romanomermis culicivorax TaxID=13658 RepID=A0A915IKS0_ROMCU
MANAEYHSLKSSIAEGDEECSADEQWTVVNSNNSKPSRDNLSSRSSSFGSPLIIENRSTKKRSHSLKAQQHLIRVIADAHNDR